MVGEDNKLSSKSKVNLARLPPCYSALKPHIHRVNHRVALYKRADENIFECPKPYDDEQGWIRNEDDVLEPLWSCNPVLPVSLIDLLASINTEEEEDKEDEPEMEEIDSDAFDESDDDF